MKLLFLGHRSLIKNKTQAAVINIVSFRSFINLTFDLLERFRRSWYARSSQSINRQKSVNLISLISIVSINR